MQKNPGLLLMEWSGCMCRSVWLYPLFSMAGYKKKRSMA